MSVQSGWNRAVDKPSVAPKKKGPAAWVIAVAVSVVAVAFAVWLFLPTGGGGGEGAVGEQAKGRIKEVEPAAAPKAETKPAKPKMKRPSEMTREERLAWMEKRYGNNIPESLKTTYYFLKNPPTQNYEPRPRREDIFRHQSEKSIASVLLIEPGAFLLQKTIYDEQFDRDFRKSLEDPTIITSDDTEEQRELKRAVNETKAELAERMRAGEKPSDIMNAAIDQAYELGKYKRNIEEMLHDIDIDPTRSDEEVNDFVKAANKMLTDKGATEITMPNLVRRQTRLKVLARRAEQKKAAAEKSKEEKK